MNTRFSHIVTVAAAFTAGLCAGMMMAPASGKALRRRMQQEARNQLKVAEEQLEKVESQLNKVNDRIQAAGKDLTDRVKEAADEIIPDLAKDDEHWNLTKEDMEKELRHLSRR